MKNVLISLQRFELSKFKFFYFPIFEISNEYYKPFKNRSILGTSKKTEQNIFFILLKFPPATMP